MLVSQERRLSNTPVIHIIFQTAQIIQTFVFPSDENILYLLFKRKILVEKFKFPFVLPKLPFWFCCLLTKKLYPIECEDRPSYFLHQYCLNCYFFFFINKISLRMSPYNKNVLKLIQFLSIIQRLSQSIGLKITELQRKLGFVWGRRFQIIL